MPQFNKHTKIWREVFLDIALRAIRRVHYEFGIWELGQTKLNLKDFSNLNQGNGISFAPEETVRDAISQEIMLSGLWKKHPINNEDRSYWIDREVRVKFKVSDAENSEFYTFLFKSKDYEPESKKHFDIDLVFKRIEPEADDKQTTIPTLIEAKRFELVNVNLNTKRTKIGKPQLNGIDRDILRLKLLKEIYSKDKKIKLKGKHYEGFRTYILIWGLSSVKLNLNKILVNKLKEGRYISQTERGIRYLPIQWSEELKVTKFLWLTLLQVD